MTEAIASKPEVITWPPNANLLGYKQLALSRKQLLAWQKHFHLRQKQLLLWSKIAIWTFNSYKTQFGDKLCLKVGQKNGKQILILSLTAVFACLVCGGKNTLRTVFRSLFMPNT
jgi:hypothetical protein